MLRRGVYFHPAIRSLWIMRNRLSVRHQNVKNVPEWSSPMGYTLGYCQPDIRCVSCCEECFPRIIPGMGITVRTGLRKDTGGERWFPNPTWKQGTFWHSGWNNSGYFSPFCTFSHRFALLMIVVSLPDYRRVWTFPVRKMRMMRIVDKCAFLRVSAIPYRIIRDLSRNKAEISVKTWE